MAETIRTIVLDANVLAAAAVALAAGLVSFASPCVLPLVPGYLSYVTGLTGEALSAGDGGRIAVRVRARLLVGSVLFVLGFAVPFALLGWAAGLLNLLERSAVAQAAMGAVVTLLGVQLARGRLVREVRVADRAPRAGLLGAPVLGFVFGVGWTPCLGPTAGAILTLSAGVGGGVSARGAFLGLVYALGLGLPFVALAVAVGRAGRVLAALKRHARRLQVGGGVLLALVGLAIATGLWARWMVALRPLVSGIELPI
jgi:cytochrome c-type biogenesis protein